MKDNVRFKRAELTNLLSRLSDRLRDAGIQGELLLFGGAAMLLGWNSRLSTRDVDGLFIPAATIRRIAADLADEDGLPANWLNDAVKGFLDRPVSPGECRELAGFSNLRIFIPPPEYLIATKAVAARTDPGHEDVADLKFLLRRQKIQESEAVMRLVEYYFPSRALPAKTRFFIEAVLEEIQEEDVRDAPAATGSAPRNKRGKQCNHSGRHSRASGNPNRTSRGE